MCIRDRISWTVAANQSPGRSLRGIWINLLWKTPRCAAFSLDRWRPKPTRRAAFPSRALPIDDIWPRYEESQNAFFFLWFRRKLVCARILPHSFSTSRNPKGGSPLQVIRQKIKKYLTKIWNFDRKSSQWQLYLDGRFWSIFQTVRSLLNQELYAVEMVPRWSSFHGDQRGTFSTA